MIVCHEGFRPASKFGFYKCIFSDLTDSPNHCVSASVKIITAGEQILTNSTSLLLVPR